jgi:hypothetical protein
MRRFVALVNLGRKLEFLSDVLKKKYPAEVELPLAVPNTSGTALDVLTELIVVSMYLSS